MATTDLAILAQLEKEIRKKLKKLDSPYYDIPGATNVGYTIDSGNIVGITLDGIALERFPVTIFKFQHLKVLSLFNNKLTKIPKDIKKLTRD